MLIAMCMMYSAISQSKMWSVIYLHVRNKEENKWIKPPQNIFINKVGFFKNNKLLNILLITV